MRLRAQEDENQKTIVTQLRSLGFLVEHTHQIGRGKPDILVSGFSSIADRVLLSWWEIKNGKKKLTEDEVLFHQKWEGHPIGIATTVDEILEWYGRK